MEILPMFLKPFLDSLSFDGQLQRSVRKADSGMARRRPRGRHCPAGHRVSTRGAYQRAAECLPAGVLFTATSWTRASQLVGRLAGLAAVELGSANDLTRLRLTRMAAGAGGESSRLVQAGLNVETLPFLASVPAHTGPVEPAADFVAGQAYAPAARRRWGRARVG